jgi:hypothetical protein
MLRFIMLRKVKHLAGLEMQEYFTLKNLLDVESYLTRGGVSEDHYDYYTVVGVEVIPDKPQ